MNKAHVTHPELKATFSLDILGVKKNPNGAMYSSLGVITKGERGPRRFQEETWLTRTWVTLSLAVGASGARGPG